jgi:hypothetical protein
MNEFASASIHGVSEHCGENRSKRNPSEIVLTAKPGERNPKTLFKWNDGSLVALR